MRGKAVIDGEWIAVIPLKPCEALMALGYKHGSCDACENESRYTPGWFSIKTLKFRCVACFTPVPA